MVRPNKWNSSEILISCFSQRNYFEYEPILSKPRWSLSVLLLPFIIQTYQFCFLLKTLTELSVCSSALAPLTFNKNLHFASWNILFLSMFIAIKLALYFCMKSGSNQYNFCQHCNNNSDDDGRRWAYRC